MMLIPAAVVKTMSTGAVLPKAAGKALLRPSHFGVSHENRFFDLWVRPISSSFDNLKKIYI